MKYGEKEGLKRKDMNRELKFRIWDNGTKNMREVFSFCKDYIKVIVDGNVYKWNRPNFEPIMQYTGLNDRTGKPIYEGDIIKDWCGIREVKFTIGDNMQGYDLEIDDTDLEVLGNIFEHPHLLTQNK